MMEVSLGDFLVLLNPYLLLASMIMSVHAFVYVLHYQLHWDFLELVFYALGVEPPAFLIPPAPVVYDYDY